MVVSPGIIALLLAASCSSAGTGAATSTGTDTSVWKKVDKSLTDGVRTVKKKLLEPEEKPKETPKRKSSNGHELEEVTDSLNEAWDSVVRGAGKLLKTQQTGTGTETSTATRHKSP